MNIDAQSLINRLKRNYSQAIAEKDFEISLLQLENEQYEKEIKELNQKNKEQK